MTKPNKDFGQTEADVPMLFLSDFSQKISDATQDEVHTWYRYAVAQRLVTGAVRCTRNICPTILDV